MKAVGQWDGRRLATRGLEPVIKLLDQLAEVEYQSPETQAFVKAVQDIRLFSGKTDSLLESFLKADSDWFIRTFLKKVK